jgi:hypothetical protein
MKKSLWRRRQKQLKMKRKVRFEKDCVTCRKPTKKVKGSLITPYGMYRYRSQRI